ncbi:MAG: DUF1080 domain-containing protein [Coprobacter sp.]|nr:DUF1080 domain-containing protein [Coprobacter sp.]
MKKYILPMALVAIVVMSACTKSNDGFVKLFNGEDWTGWYLKIRSGDSLMAQKVYAIENGMVHVFGDAFPDSIELNTGENATHGLFYSEKEYSRFIFRFEYKWGIKIANNFDQWQYDAGFYYHVINDKIWPKGMEYQVRYNHITGLNHTGDMWCNGTRFDWTSGPEKRFLCENEGGKLQERRGGEHKAKLTTNFHALDNEWNSCEIIVMGDKYAIHKLNGEIVNMATNLSVSKGKIGLQSETAEIYYRNIYIKEFDEDIPMDKFLK